MPLAADPHSPVLRLLYVIERIERGLLWSERLSDVALDEVSIAIGEDQAEVDVTGAFPEFRARLERVRQQCVEALTELRLVEADLEELSAP